MPSAEVEISLELVQTLIAELAPQWAELELSYLATGWDNEVYRLGEEYLVRLPRRELGERIGKSERQWLPKLSTETGVIAGEVLFAGCPTNHYPFTFSVTRYVPGVSAATLTRSQRDNYANEFVSLLKQIHSPASDPRPVSSFRGCPLSAVEEKTREQISQLPAEHEGSALALWERALVAQPYLGPPAWLHGDPHPHNTIVRPEKGQYHLSSLVDYGDLCTGDPASDLGMLWMHFTPEAVCQAFSAYGVDKNEPMFSRSLGWALRYAMLTAQLAPRDPLGIVGRETLAILFRVPLPPTS